MNHFCAHADAGEPAVRLNLHDPARPFAVITFGEDRDFTSKDPVYCRRVARAWTTAAELLEPALRRAAELQHDPDREAGQ